MPAISPPSPDAYPQPSTRSILQRPIKYRGFPTKSLLVPLAEAGEDTMGQAAGDMGDEESNP